MKMKVMLIEGATTEHSIQRNIMNRRDKECIMETDWC